MVDTVGVRAVLMVASCGVLVSSLWCVCICKLVGVCVVSGVAEGVNCNGVCIAITLGVVDTSRVCVKCICGVTVWLGRVVLWSSCVRGCELTGQ